MTNQEIIFNESIRLMKEGIIGSTGRTITVENSEGERIEMPEPEPIHTFAAWKSQGRQVKKGEKCKADILIWKASRRPTQDAQESQDAQDAEATPERIRMFMHRAFFFTISQTEPI